MSYDVLVELRRRLVGRSDVPRDERRSGEDRAAASVPPAPMVADGGRRREREDDEHLRDLPDGAGCTEIWEHLSERQTDEGRASEPGARECRADD